MWRTRHLRSEELKTYLRQSVQFIFNRVNEQFDESESESEVSYFITHILDRVIYILSQASLLFYVSTELESLFLRACQIIVDVWRALSNKITNSVGTKKKSAWKNIYHSVKMYLTQLFHEGALDIRW